MTRREIPLDAGEILRVLAEHRVGYVVIGGLAVQTHGHPRTTQDLDIIPEPGDENLHRLQAALAALRARRVGAQAAQPVTVPSRGVLELDTAVGGLDVHADPPGAASYPELRERSLELDLGLGAPVLVVGLDDLIAMKRASGRPLDRSDILALTDPSSIESPPR